MQFFMDTADIDSIDFWTKKGFVDGVTTNPSLIKKSGKNLLETLKSICAIVNGPVSAEVLSNDLDQIMAESEVLAAIAPNICVKLPLTDVGLQACRILSEKGIKTNVTLCFSPVQALLAGKSGATYISPFIGRVDDICEDGMDLIHDIRTIYDNYTIGTKILAASVRTINHVKNAALAEADAITIPPELYPKLFTHPLTTHGLETFTRDSQQSHQKIV